MRAPSENPPLCAVCGTPIQRRSGRGRKPSYHAACRAAVQQGRVAVNRGQLDAEVRRARQASHTYLARHGLTRRGALNALEQLSPSANLLPTIRRDPAPSLTTDGYERAQRELDRLKSLFIQNVVPFSNIFAAAHAIQLTLVHAKDVSLDAFYLWIGCEELLMDSGESGNLLAAIQRLDARATTIEQFYAARRDTFNLARTLLVHAKIYRDEYTLTQDTRTLQQAIWATIHAYQILTGMRDQRAEVVFLRHWAVGQRLKLISFDARVPENAASVHRLLRALTRESPDERMALATLREEAGYFRAIGDLKHAEKCVEELEEMVTDRFPSQPPRLRLSLLHPQINLFLEPEYRNMRAAREKLEEYFTLWRQNPTAYEQQRLREWENRGLRSPWSEIHVPVHFSPSIPVIVSDG